MGVYLNGEKVGATFVEKDNKFASLVDRSITEVTAEDLEGITVIGSYVFYGCTKLARFVIPSNIVSISSGQFNNATKLKSIDYLGTLEEWCNITFESQNSNPTMQAMKLVIKGEEIDDLIIPQGIIEIKNNSFYNCKNITSLHIHDSVTSIGDYAFYGCSKLTSITIPSSVTSIGYQAFSYCSGLTSVVIGNGITSIGGGAFWSNNKLTEITIKATTPPTLGTSAIPSTVQTIYIPTGTLQAYSSATNWKTHASKFVETDMEG